MKLNHKYYIPVIVFAIIFLTMYFLEKDKEKRNTVSFILVRAFLPALTSAVVSFVVLSKFNKKEALMEGNYFQPTVLENTNVAASTP
jgi:RsiW-degrading membrane proteinase PrsW (M82 family)